MMRIDPERIAAALLCAPGWARVGIAAPTEVIRLAAAQELALIIARQVTDEMPAPDPDQMKLAL